MLDPEFSLQDVIRCHICETPVPPMYCDVCDEYICKKCVGEYLSDQSIKHMVVSNEKKSFTPVCQKKYTIPICKQCVSSKDHRYINRKKEVIQEDLKELEKSIYPTYQQMASNIPVQKAALDKNCQSLTTNSHQQTWRRHQTPGRSK